MTKLSQGRAPRPRADDGFSLVEMMVSLLIIAMVAGAFISVLVSTLAGTRQLDARTTANQLAQDRLESVVSRPWPSIGFYAADPGYAATGADGQPTVTLSGVRPTVAPVPSETTSVRGGTYTVRSDITWRDDPSDLLGAADRNGDTRDGKHVVVSVDWADGGRTGKVSLDGQRSPTVAEVPAANAGSALTVSVTAPASQSLNATNYPVSPTMTVVAQASGPATAMSLSFSTRAGVQSVPMTGSGTYWTWTLPTSMGPFDTGSTTFTATASSSVGGAKGSAVVQMVAGAGASTFTATAAPSQTLTASGSLSRPITVSVTGSTAIASASLSYPVSGGPASAATWTGSGTSRSAEIPADTSKVFSTGELSIALTVSFVDGTSASGTASLMLYSSDLPPDLTKLEVSSQKFCVDSRDYRLFTATDVLVTVANIRSTDAVMLTAPDFGYEKSMTYRSANADGTLVFGYTVPVTDQFPMASGIVLKAYAVKTISGQQYRDDIVTNPAVPIKAVKKGTPCL